MKMLKPSILILLATLTLFGCKAPRADNQTNENQTDEVVISNDIQVYYFHNTKRCATCNAIEDETLMALQMFYPEQTEAGTIEFTSLNLEKEEGESMAESLKVSGQTLLLVKGETQVNLTNEGFMNARTNPTKFHEILKTELDKLL
ncbi:MAG: hypothetical protein KAI08_07540 [Bacteroidales bacterium]|nr:hypothetical protein [Bacteroidales bacterium]